MYFTYMLAWPKLNKFYYGVRYSDKATTSSIGTTYFSSSKYVKRFIEEFGNPTHIEIRRIFDSKLKAKRWEEKVIRRLGMIASDIWLNMGNNNSFRDIIMNDEIRASISKAQKGKRTGFICNNGIENMLVKSIEDIPEGWTKGRISSEKQKQHIKNLNGEILNHQKRKEMGKKVSITTKGKPKPEGFGEKLSRATKGKPREWTKGENNISKREDVRKKISDSWKTRVIGLWYTDGKENHYIKPGEDIPEGCVRGKTINVSPERRLKMSIFKKNNPPKNKGFKHIHNIETRENKFIHPDKLESYLQSGWKIGCLRKK